MSLLDALTSGHLPLRREDPPSETGTQLSCRPEHAPNGLASRSCPSHAGKGTRRRVGLDQLEDIGNQSPSPMIKSTIEGVLFSASAPPFKELPQHRDEDTSTQRNGQVKYFVGRASSSRKGLHHAVLKYARWQISRRDASL